MKNTHVSARVRTPKIHSSIGRLLALALIGSLIGAPTDVLAGDSEIPQCGGDYDPERVYPSLPLTDGPDLIAEAGVVVYLHPERAVVEIGDCFYALDRELEIDFGGLDLVVVLFELAAYGPGTTLLVSTDGEWTQALELDTPTLSYALNPTTSHGFALSAPGQERPVTPLIETKPSSQNPVP